MARTLLLLVLLVAFAADAAAHPGAAGSSLGEGVAHPLSGLDHLLAMLAVGLWAGQSRGRARWALPVTFVAAMALGASLGAGGVPLPAVEAGIAASVFVLGLLIAAAARWPVLASVPLVAAFALFHGHAHGTELPAAGGAAYAVGFLLGTAALHALGLGLATFSAQGRSLPLVRVAGAAIAVAGLLLWVR